MALLVFGLRKFLHRGPSPSVNRIDRAKTDSTPSDWSSRPRILDRSHHVDYCDAGCRHEIFGDFLSDLLTEPQWILRRIETVEFLNTGRYQRRVTLDISTSGLRERLRRAGLQDASATPVPFALLPKGLLVDVDLVDSGGQSKAILTSDEDSFAAQLLCASLLRKNENFATGDQLFLNALSDAGASPLRLSTAATEMVRFFSDNFMMMTDVPVDRGDVLLIKFRLVESSSTELKRDLLESLGVRSTFYLIDAPSVGRAHREHLRVVAPPGTFVDSLQLYREVDSEDQTRQEGASYTFRLVPERAAIYTRDIPAGRYALGVTLRPQPSGSLVAALLASLMASAIAFFVLIYEWFTRAFSNAEGGVNADPTVALILVAPTLAAGFVFRNGEHSTFSRQVAWLRWIFGFGVASSVVAALIFAVGLGGHQTLLISWMIAGILNTTAAIIIAVVFSISLSSRRRVRQNDNTSSDNTWDLYFGD